MCFPGPGPVRRAACTWSPLAPSLWAPVAPALGHPRPRFLTYSSVLSRAPKLSIVLGAHLLRPRFLLFTETRPTREALAQPRGSEFRELITVSVVVDTLSH